MTAAQVDAVERTTALLTRFSLSTAAPELGQRLESAGHVAMVLEVGPSTHAKADQVYVEQYDWNPVCGYNRQTFKVPAAGTHFIHLSAALQPPQPTPTTPSWWWWQKEHA